MEILNAEPEPIAHRRGGTCGNVIAHFVGKRFACCTICADPHLAPGH
jgi:hypothetical protein